jgi:mono/diheme cytochrome c family protein
MNYPLWDIPAPGLLIALVAIVHVFVSHFAVGGGLFLVVAERKARRENDDALLGWVKRHSRFFILLTLVFGAITGVGIWFTIGLVHPAATSTLINAFVWGWAIEWTFFVTEIAAAIVYYYGWEKLTPRQHLTVGWVYFGAAWASLLVINGILAFMLTPGSWVADRSFWSGYFNPTFPSSLVIRTLGSIGLAGVYAVLTASWMRWSAAEEQTKRKLISWAAWRWVVPMAVLLPIALAWYFAAAVSAGIPVGEIFGAGSNGLRDLAGAAFTMPKATTGHTIIRHGLRGAFTGIGIALLVALIIPLLRGRMQRVASVLLLAAAFLAVGGSEWTREDLRKPYVIGQTMFVNGLRLPPPAGSLAAGRAPADPWEVGHVIETGLLSSAKWARYRGVENPTIDEEAAAGAEIFRLSCSQCHTIDGYLAIRPLVRGQNAAALEGLMGRLATPRAADGKPAQWSTPGVQLATWRSRRMPPFAGNDEEKRALSVYLATLGGGAIAPRTPAVSGAMVFDAACGMCHGPDGDWPMPPRIAGRNAEQLYELLGRLPQLNDMMPPFEGTDAERRALANHLATMGGTK